MSQTLSLYKILCLINNRFVNTSDRSLLRQWQEKRLTNLNVITGPRGKTWRTHFGVLCVMQYLDPKEFKIIELKYSDKEL